MMQSFLDFIQQIVNRFGDFLAAGMLSMFGGMSAHFYHAAKNKEPFSWSSFLVNGALAFFVGHLLGSFLPSGFEYRDGILMLAGFSTWPILQLLEDLGPKLIEKVFRQRTGL